VEERRRNEKKEGKKEEEERHKTCKYIFGGCLQGHQGNILSMFMSVKRHCKFDLLWLG
jgi:hypothetical protein